MQTNANATVRAHARAHAYVHGHLGTRPRLCESAASGPCVASFVRRGLTPPATSGGATHSQAQCRTHHSASWLRCGATDRARRRIGMRRASCRSLTSTPRYSKSFNTHPPLHRPTTSSPHRPTPHRPTTPSHHHLTSVRLRKDRNVFPRVRGRP